MLIQRPSLTPRLLLRNNRTIIIAEASSAAAATATEADPARFTAIGYRQTLLPAAKGGKANRNGFRFRNGGMRALARTFRDQVFIAGHDWSDPRNRAGTIEDAYAEEMPGDVEMAVYFDLFAQAPWALEGLANGTIDRFSFGVDPVGEITCTVHNQPVFQADDCYCWPGETVTGEDGREVIAEWEYEGGIGLELSAVNVPAVEGTGVVRNAPGVTDKAALAALVAARGRTARTRYEKPRASVAVPVQEGGSTPASAPITMTSQHEARAIMDRALICKSLGLPATATDEEILARTNQLATASAQNEVLRTQLAEVGQREQTLAAERDAAHVEAELSRLRASRTVSDEIVAKLRASAGTSRAAFDSTLAIVEMSAPAINAAPALGTKPALQSATPPAAVPGVIAAAAEGPDAFEANRTNPNLPLLMKGCGVSVDDIRKHGARQFVTETNLEQLIKDTAARGDDMGTGPTGKQTFFTTGAR